MDIKIGKHNHHETSGHGRKRREKFWVLDDQGEKTTVYFSFDDYEPKTRLT